MRQLSRRELIKGAAGGTLLLSGAACRQLARANDTNTLAPLVTQDDRIPAVLSDAGPSSGPPIQDLGRPARAPLTPYRGSRRGPTADQGIQVFTLGSVVTTEAPARLTRPASLGKVQYVVTYLVFAGQAGETHMRVRPVAANLGVLDSTGVAYPSSYLEIGYRDGISIGAVSFRPNQEGVKQLLVDLTALQASGSPGLTSVIRGNWTLEVLQQLVDRPDGPSTSAIAAQNPVQVNGVTVRYWLAGSLDRITIDSPSAPQSTLYPFVEYPTGALRLLSAKEYDQMRSANAPPTPRPYTPLPGGPIYQNTPIPTPNP